MKTTLFFICFLFFFHLNVEALDLVDTNGDLISNGGTSYFISSTFRGAASRLVRLSSPNSNNETCPPDVTLFFTLSQIGFPFTFSARERVGFLSSSFMLSIASWVRIPPCGGTVWTVDLDDEGIIRAGGSDFSYCFRIVPGRLAFSYTFQYCCGVESSCVPVRWYVKDGVEHLAAGTAQDFPFEFVLIKAFQPSKSAV